jgi:hypothetical protein
MHSGTLRLNYFVRCTSHLPFLSHELRLIRSNFQRSNLSLEMSAEILPRLLRRTAYRKIGFGEAGTRVWRLPDCVSEKHSRFLTSPKRTFSVIKFQSLDILI